MDYIIEFVQENYIAVIAVGAFIVFTVIGFFVDRSQKKKYKEQIRRESLEEIKADRNGYEEQIIQEDQAKDFINSENYDLSDVRSNSRNTDVPAPYAYTSENIPSEEPTSHVVEEENNDASTLDLTSLYKNVEQEPVVEEPKIEETQNIEMPNEVDNNQVEQQEEDSNIQYLTENNKEEKKTESIDDFLQRTMKEAYQPTYTEEQDNNVDYEDTLPIPIQNENEFSKVEITDVNNEVKPEETKEESTLDLTNLFNKQEDKTVEDNQESTVEFKPEIKVEQEVDQNKTQEIDFKPIEDAILESLGRLSEREGK